jgi:hypothetical protein
VLGIRNHKRRALHRFALQQVQLFPALDTVKKGNQLSSTSNHRQGGWSKMYVQHKNEEVTGGNKRLGQCSAQKARPCARKSFDRYRFPLTLLIGK